jgi:hypothetical protein
MQSQYIYGPLNKDEISLFEGAIQLIPVNEDYFVGTNYENKALSKKLIPEPVVEPEPTPEPVTNTIV